MNMPNPEPGAKLGISGRYLANSVTVIPDFLDAALCHEVRLAMDGGAAEPAEILDQGAALDREARRAAVIDIDPATLAAVEARLDAAREALSVRCGVPLGRREGAGFIRYFTGGFYRPHRDRALDGDWPGAAERLISLVVFLNDGFEGGALAIYPESPHNDLRDPILITPQRGSLVAFDATLLHEVHAVAAGTRDVIVDWFYEVFGL